MPAHEALRAELCLLEICQGPIREGGRMTHNSEVTVDAHRFLPFAVGAVASKGMDRLVTFLSNPVVKKK